MLTGMKIHNPSKLLELLNDATDNLTALQRGDCFCAIDVATSC